MTPLLPPGSRVAVVAPSGVSRPARLAAGYALARQAGYELVIPRDLEVPHRYLAGDDAHRLAQLTAALTDPTVDGVWASRGGYGVLRLLHRLPWERIRPVPLIGFSDLTPLLHHHGLHGGVPIHGPVLHSLATTDAADRQALFDLLATGRAPELVGDVLVPGTASGPVWGGNLAMLAATVGTPWAPDLTGALVALEDVGEAPYRIDRLLWQVRSAGLLDGVAGVLLGTFTGCEAPEGAAWSTDDVLHEALAPLDVPVLAGLPFGHGRRHVPLPLGRTARIDGASLCWDRP